MPQVLEELRQRGIECTVDAVFAEGRNDGATMVTTGGGHRHVLKLFSGRTFDWAVSARRAVDRVRATGWPSPTWSVIGALPSGIPYALQDIAPGQPLLRITEASAHQLVAINRLQVGLAHPFPEFVDYNSRLAERLFADDDYVGAVRNASSTADKLVNSLFMHVRDDVTLNSGDFVHGDYSRSNLLATEEAITSLVDLENLGWGSRIFDLTDQYRQMILFVDTPQARRILRAEIESVAGPAAFYACFAYWTTTNLGWIEQNFPDELNERVELLSAFVASPEFTTSAVAPKRHCSPQSDARNVNRPGVSGDFSA